MLTNLLHHATRLDRIGMQLLRYGTVLVLLWIGALKVYKYEADGIVPFVANSPVMSFFYHFDAPDHMAHKNPEGLVVPANRAWHEANHTYSFALGLGAVICLIGVLIALYPWFPKLSALGSFLCVGMAVVTLSFLITTPETWVPDLGGPEHGFPLLSAAGRLVVKDAIMLGAGVVTLADAARKGLGMR
ncbi:MAG: DUF417 family protein [Flavobacteriales bacterium]|jgi:uncharacterized membrane protein YkgB|nr:DUF417 family protein [Flavobacteriales bacterium]